MLVSDMEVHYIDHCGSDLSIVNAARVSFNKQSDFIWTFEKGSNESTPMLQEKDVKLINYLAKHKHLSPFNHCFISVRVKAPIFVARQLVKHEYMPWNEVSRRYVDEEPEFYFPDVWRARADNVKQGSSEVEASWVGTISVSRILEEVVSQYKWMLENGVCPEQARMILPQNMMTEWYWSGTLSAFAKMLSLRLSSDTQKETRDVAEKARDIIMPLFPVSLSALLEEY